MPTMNKTYKNLDDIYQTLQQSKHKLNNLADELNETLKNQNSENTAPLYAYEVKLKKIIKEELTNLQDSLLPHDTTTYHGKIRNLEDTLILATDMTNLLERQIHLMEHIPSKSPMD